MEINSKFNVCYIFVIYISLPLSLIARPVLVVFHHHCLAILIYSRSKCLIIQSNRNIFPLSTISSTMADCGCKFLTKKKNEIKQDKLNSNMKSIDLQTSKIVKTKPRSNRCHSQLQNSSHKQLCSDWNDFLKIRNLMRWKRSQFLPKTEIYLLFYRQSHNKKYMYDDYEEP